MTTLEALMARMPPRLPSDAPEDLDGYLQRAAWSRIGQAFGLFLTNMDHEPREDAERAWEDAILAKAEAILTERQKP